MILKNSQWIVLFLTYLASVNLALAAESIAVYYPTSLTVQERQKSLKEETQLDVTVFSKFSEFEDFVKDKGPNILIAPSSYTNANKAYGPSLKFTEMGHPTFKYVVLSLSNKWTSQNINTAKLGVVQELERGVLKDYFNEVLGTHISIIKYVSKLEDLFSLLVFNSADVIAVSSYNYDLLRAQFTSKVIKVTESKPALAPLVYVKSGYQDNQEIAKLTKLTEKTLGILGFSKVEAFQPGTSP